MQAYARYFLRKYFVRSRCELTVAGKLPFKRRLRAYNSVLFYFENEGNGCKKVRMNYRKERLFLLGVIEGILFSSQKREYPLTFTNFEPKLHFRAGLPAKKTLNPSGLKKF